MVESLGSLFSCANYPHQDPFAPARLNSKTSGVTGMSSSNTGGSLDSYNSLYDQTVSSPLSELWPFSSNTLENDRHSYQLYESSYNQDIEHRQQYQQLAEDYMFNLHQHHRVPIICRLLQDCMDLEMKSTRSSSFLARYISNQLLLFYYLFYLFIYDLLNF